MSSDQAAAVPDAATAEFKKYLEQYQRENTIADLAPTVCELLGIRKPAQCSATPIAEVVDQASHIFSAGKAEKIFIYAPDAIGETQLAHRPDLAERIRAVAGIQVPSVALMPSVTPVCYGSIFTGAPPAIHGIRVYAKPVLEVETIFEPITEAGLKAVVISINNCSIDCIMRKRKIEYFSMLSSERSFEMAKRMLVEEDYDVIICYNGSYDHFGHKTGVFSPESIREYEQIVDHFEILAELVDRCWTGKDRAMIFVPDHGQHFISEDQGGHGKNCPEDMLVSHFYRLRAD